MNLQLSNLKSQSFILKNLRVILSKITMNVISFLMLVLAFNRIAYCQEIAKEDSVLAAQHIYNAKVFAGQQLWDSAQYYLASASEIYLKNESWLNLLNSENSIGYVFMLQYDYKSAVEHFQKFESDYGRFIPGDVQELANFYGNIGYSCGRLGQYFQSIKYWTRNLEINLKQHDGFDARVSHAYASLGGLYRKVGRYDKSLENSFKALSIADSTHNISTQVNCYNDLGLTYRRLGEFKAASHFYQKLLSVDKAYTWKRYEHFLNNLALVHQAAEENIAAAGIYNQILDTLRIRPDKYRPIGSMESVALINLANVHMNLNDLVLAEEKAAKAIEVRIKAYGTSSASLVPMYNILGNIKLKQGAYQDALQCFDKSAALFDTTKAVVDVENLKTFLGKAKTLRKLGAFDEALDLCQMMIVHLVDNFDDRNVSMNPDLGHYIRDKRLLLNTLRLKSMIYVEKYKEAQEVAVLELAHKTDVISAGLIEEIRKSLQTEESKTFIADQNYELIEAALSTTFKLYSHTEHKKYLDDAFNFFEISKASLLKENLFDKQFKLFTNIPDSLKEKEAQLISEIKFLENRLYKVKYQADTLPIAVIKAELVDKQLAYETLQKQFRKRFERYYNLKVGGQQFDLKSFQKKILFNKQMVLQFFVGKEKVYALAVTHKDIKLYQYAIDDISPVVNAYYDAILNKNQENYERYAYQIYDRLLKDLLSKHKGINHLVFIADDILAGIPFETLLTHSSDEKNTKNIKPYLLRDYEISYHYSADLMASNFFATNKEADNNFIGFAPIVDQWQSDSAAITYRGGLSLSPLPGAQDEVKKIASLLGGEFRAGEEATEANFKTAIQKANILHVASHALIDSKEPLYSKLYFTPSPTDKEDGYLHAYELYNMDIKSSMVSLSACNTGIGKYFKGEGVQSLGRGFMYAGAPSVMMSLWAVPDNATTKIMTFFYEELKKGKSESKALRHAKLRYLDQADKNTVHPYYWGAFIYVGHNSPVSRMKPSQYLLIFVVLFILIVFYRWKIKDRNSATSSDSIRRKDNI